MKRFNAGETTGTTQETQQATGQLYVNHPIQRVGNTATLTGRGRYTDDLGMKPGTFRAATLHLPHTHAGLGLTDFVVALKALEVRVVLTGADLPA